MGQRSDSPPQAIADPGRHGAGGRERALAAPAGRALARRKARAEAALWYKDAIIYELHVRAFADSDDDGIGDFRGLEGKLDYLQSLGVTALWLLPFYPSPLRDDGYDIADYRGVLPDYGTLRDFRRFVRSAHDRGLKVITELVVNHTSDQHPWFQAARRAPRGSAKRNFYVWSDTDTALAGTRIIFTDTETSNWAWDPVAEQYYWHRFFSHQPDLNLNNPAVVRAVIGVMKFWLDLGVDGLRLDAVPYLCVREGTNNENLPETHAVLREFRRFIDENYENRMLLAEANQWPDDVRAYFGDGDECHMAFHFPVMPRIYMALRQEDRHPIVDILSHTPEIPPDCQWALFLRNHDELTLEMVTDEERDYMYREYAQDARMRVNVGIRRRLAPLVDASLRRIELLNSLLFSFPGTPVLYYGDEIGMGDNIWLGDRNGVRTPMQWSADRNAGFSRADPARLFAPVIMDPVYGYTAVNVEAQQRNPSSMLHFMQRMIALRRQHKAFGRGTIEFLAPDNRKVLAYLRKHRGEVILCVANLSRYVQAAELDLRAYDGWTPVEMIGRNELPAIGELPYFVTLGPHSFYWFKLERQAQPLRLGSRTEDAGVSLPRVELVYGGTDGIAAPSVLRALEQDVLPTDLPRRRWFRGKARKIARVAVREATKLGGRLFLLLVDVTYEPAPGEATAADSETYVLPLRFSLGEPARRVAREVPESLVATVTAGDQQGVLYDAMAEETSCCALFQAMADGRVYRTTAGNTVAAFATPALVGEDGRDPECGHVRRLSVEQSNTSVVLDDRFVLKLYRRLEDGPNPDAEIGLFLTAHTDFRHVAAVAGGIELRAAEAPPRGRGRRGAAAGGGGTIAMLQSFVPNQGDGWEYTLHWLQRWFEDVTAGAEDPLPTPPGGLTLAELAARPLPEAAARGLGTYRDAVGTLARRTAELHLALASAPRGLPTFYPQPASPSYLSGLAAAFRQQARQALELLRHRKGAAAAGDEGVAELAEAVLGAGPELLARFDALPDLGRGVGRRIRVHGDYHLGQVLRVANDWLLLDFEGEPLRPLLERREPQLALKDVAGMLRSFAYAAWTALFRVREERPATAAVLEPHGAAWERWVSAAFLQEYLATAGAAPFLPTEGRDGGLLSQLLDLWLLDKAAYELVYELNNRPRWVRLPLLGITRLLGTA
jgi:maltose alpha-D-glucosyltransferase/alpha-amylase